MISLTDLIQLTLTLKITTAQVVETSVTVNNNSPIQDYVHLDDQTQPTFERFMTKAKSALCARQNYKLAFARNNLILSDSHSYQHDFIANEQPRVLRGGSLIKPCAKVPWQNESRIDVT